MRPAPRGAPLPSLSGLCLHLQSKPVAPTMVNFRESQPEECLLCSAPLHVGEYGVLNPSDLVDMDAVDLFRSAWRTASLRCGHRYHRRCLASHFVNVPPAQRLCPQGVHGMDATPNGAYQYVFNGPGTPQAYVPLSADDNADIDQDIQDNMFAPPNQDDTDDAYHNDQEKRWYDETMRKRDELIARGEKVVDEGKWADKLQAMVLERNRYKATWDAVKEKLDECEKQLREVKQEREKLQEQNKRLAQSGANDEEAAKIIDDMIKENATLKNEIEKQSVAARTQDQILDMHERRFEANLAAANNAAKLAEDATRASEKRVTELEQGLRTLENKLKDEEYTNRGNTEQMLYEREENAKQMASMEEELGKAKDELAVCREKLAKKQADLVSTVDRLKGQFKEYRAGMEERLAREQEECETKLRVLRRELEDCEEELRKRGSAPPKDEEDKAPCPDRDRPPGNDPKPPCDRPPKDDDDGDAESTRIANEAAAALVARTMERVAREADEEQKAEAEKQKKLESKKVTVLANYARVLKEWTDKYASPVPVELSRLMAGIIGLGYKFQTTDSLVNSASLLDVTQPWSNLFAVMLAFVNAFEYWTEHSRFMSEDAEAIAETQAREEKTLEWYNKMKQANDDVVNKVNDAKEKLKKDMGSAGNQGGMRGILQAKQFLLQYATKCLESCDQLLKVFNEKRDYARQLRKVFSAMDAFADLKEKADSQREKEAARAEEQLKKFQKENEARRAKTSEQGYMKNPLVVNMIQIMLSWKQRIGWLVEDMGPGKEMQELSAYGVRLMKAFNRLVIMGRLAGTIDPEDYMKNLRLAKEHPSWGDKFETIMGHEKWLIEPSEERWWMRDGGTSVKAIQQLVKSIMFLTSKLLEGSKAAQRDTIRKGVEDREFAEEAAQKVKAYKEKHSGEDTTEQMATIRDAVAKAVSAKGKAILRRAEAGIELAEAEYAYITKTCAVIDMLMVRVQNVYIPQILMDGGEFKDGTEMIWMAKWAAEFYEAPSMVPDDKSWRMQGKRRMEKADVALKNASDMYEASTKILAQVATRMDDETRQELFDAELIKSNTYDEVNKLQDLLEEVEKTAASLAKRMRKQVAEARAQADATRAMIQQANNPDMPRAKKLEKGKELMDGQEDLDFRLSFGKELMNTEIDRIRFELGFREGESREQVLLEAASYLWAKTPFEGMDSEHMETVVNECRKLMVVLHYRMEPLLTAFFRQFSPNHFSLSEEMNWLCHQFQEIQEPEDYADVEASLRGMLEHPIMKEEYIVMMMDATNRLSAVETLAEEGEGAVTQASKSASTGMQILRKSLERFNALPLPVEQKEKEILSKRVQTVERAYSDTVDFLATARKRAEDIVEVGKHSRGSLRGNVDWKGMLNAVWDQMIAQQSTPALESYKQKHKAMKQLIDNAMIATSDALGMDPNTAGAGDAYLIEALKEYKEYEKPIVEAIGSAFGPWKQLEPLLDVEKFSQAMKTGGDDVLKAWVAGYAVIAKVAVGKLRKQISAIFYVEYLVAYDLNKARASRRLDQARMWESYYERIQNVRIMLHTLMIIIKAVFTEFFPDWIFVEAVTDHWLGLVQDLNQFIEGLMVQASEMETYTNKDDEALLTPRLLDDINQAQLDEVQNEVTEKNRGMVQTALRKALGNPAAEKIVDMEIDRLIRGGRIKVDSIEWEGKAAEAVQRVSFLLESMSKDDKWKWWCRLVIAHGNDDAVQDVVNALVVYGKEKGILVPEQQPLSLRQLLQVLPQLSSESQRKLAEDAKKSPSDDDAVKLFEDTLSVKLQADAREYVAVLRKDGKSS